MKACPWNLWHHCWRGPWGHQHTRQQGKKSFKLRRAFNHSVTCIQNTSMALNHTTISGFITEWCMRSNSCLRQGRAAEEQTACAPNEWTKQQLLNSFLVKTVSGRKKFTECTAPPVNSRVSLFLFSWDAGYVSLRIHKPLLMKRSTEKIKD